MTQPTRKQNRATTVIILASTCNDRVETGENDRNGTRARA